MTAPYYERAGITIWHGDALAIMSDMEPGSVSTIATDPPYSSGARTSAALRSRGAMRRAEGKHGAPEKWFATDNLGAHGFEMLVRLFAVEARRVSIDGAHLFSFIDWRQWPTLAGAIESAGWSLRACLVWDKMHFGMGNGFRQQCEFILHASNGVGDNFVRHDLGTVFRESRPIEDCHPTMKPAGLLSKVLSAVPAGVVLDPFMGSGQTLQAARDLGYPAWGIEIDESYCELAATRLGQEVLPFS